MLRIKWNNVTLIIKYYLELKNLIKNELTQIERLNKLKSLVSISIKINNYLYKR